MFLRSLLLAGGALSVFLLIDFFSAYSDQLLLLTLQHLRMLLLALPIAVLIGVGLGIFIHNRPKFSTAILLFVAFLMTIPSIALFGLLIPALAPFGMGVGVAPAVIALVLYSLLPIVRNTFVGLNEVSVSTVRAAKGLGMTNLQVLSRIKLPLALPSILTGIRVASVLGVGIASVAAYIGGGGLGRWIFGGIRRNYPDMMLAGALAVAILALLIDAALAHLQQRAENSQNVEPTKALS